MRIGEIGEFGLIEILSKMVADSNMSLKSEHGLILGIGDDAAVVNVENSKLLITTDTLVENVHFIHDYMPWRNLGWKSMAVNLSDIAAMGGKPSFAVVTLGLHLETHVENIEELYRGILSASSSYDCIIIGGDIVKSPTTFVTIAMTGFAENGIMQRNNAKPGDLVAVTGFLGCSAAGLQILKSDRDIHSIINIEHFTKSHLTPLPRLDIVDCLLDFGINTAMDISDGLIDDLSKLCKASGVGAVINRCDIPIDEFILESFSESECFEFALNGGEDYELIFTGPSKKVLDLVHLLGDSVEVIGYITEDSPGNVSIIEKTGMKTNYVHGKGWDHFT
jgi:thiamine-monophosphate kinase